MKQELGRVSVEKNLSYGGFLPNAFSGGLRESQSLGDRR